LEKWKIEWKTELSVFLPKRSGGHLSMLPDRNNSLDMGYLFMNHSSCVEKT